MGLKRDSISINISYFKAPLESLIAKSERCMTDTSCGIRRLGYFLSNLASSDENW